MKTTDENTAHDTCRLINEFLARLETLERLDRTLTAQNDEIEEKTSKYY